jgi:hypothetical protein
MARLRDCEPVPHDLVQVDQLLAKASYTQSSAHAWLLQLRASEACGHASPPSVGAARVRLRDCEPLPHDLVQEVQLSVKAT